MANIYDGAFRTILNDCRKLIIPIINEIFGETYTGEEEIQFFPNEHFIDQQDEADRERITDTNFTVFGKIPKKYHIECESGLPDGKITIRLFEYDAQIALDEGEVTEETLTVTFPNTAVLYLRTYKKTPDKMKYVIITPGGTVQYDVPIMKVQKYSLDDIFEKRLFSIVLQPEHRITEEILSKLADILINIDLPDVLFCYEHAFDFMFLTQNDDIIYKATKLSSKYMNHLIPKYNQKIRKCFSSLIKKTPLSLSKIIELIKIDSSLADFYMNTILLDKLFNFDIFALMPRHFSISTNSGLGKFNIEIIKETI